jgi:hypothetical protein
VIRQFAERPALVIKAYARAYANPIRAPRGTILTVTPRDSEWPGWLWCTTPDGTSGWVPDSFVRSNGERAVLLRDYDATELTVNVGQLISMIEDVSGWSWCRTAENELGWIPNDCLNR